MASEPDWLTADDLERLNYRIVDGTGEPFGILKPHELASTPTRPRQLFHYNGVEDLAALAVRLMMAVVTAHPFEQGNKRTGFAAAEVFLEANGWLLVFPTSRISPTKLLRLPRMLLWKPIWLNCLAGT